MLTGRDVVVDDEGAEVPCDSVEVMGFDADVVEAKRLGSGSEPPKPKSPRNLS